MPRMCINKTNYFCYICGEVTFSSQKHSITAVVRKAYYLYFGCNVGDQDKMLQFNYDIITCQR